MSLQITGKLPAGKHKQQIQQSPNYKNGAFQNLSPTVMKPEGVSYWKMTREFFKKHPDTEPPKKIPVVKTDLSKLKGDGPVIVWFDHSSYLLRIAGRNFLIDPVFSGNAAPLSFMVKAFPGSNEYKAEDMPAIDYLVLTHDHYDHLDFKTVRKLRTQVKKVICSLGVSAHIKYWGYKGEIITELDWWQSLQPEPGITITAAPARHFSGRGIKRAQSLWSSFIVKTNTHTIYLGGDSGYDTHFKTIGQKFGPFDLAILECGQYNVMWPLIHMMPEETAQAARDLKAKMLLPVHWGKFRLSMHRWNEPIRRVLEAAAELDQPIVHPKIGQPVYLDEPFKGEQWWEM
ncbi:MAG: MBL fold metallo-hydrolase [Bacteroidetes bacterium]|nr:MBL fold metallo-hydrolase [Bacteroidota bacterium]